MVGSDCWITNLAHSGWVSIESRHQLLVSLKDQRLLSCAVHERIKKYDRDKRTQTSVFAYLPMRPKIQVENIWCRIARGQALQHLRESREVTRLHARLRRPRSRSPAAHFWPHHNFPLQKLRGEYCGCKISTQWFLGSFAWKTLVMIGRWYSRQPLTNQK